MRLLFLPLFLLACRPVGTPCVFASSRCDAGGILVTCESSGGGAGSGEIKRTKCGDGASCLEQRSPGGTANASCEVLIEEAPCDPAAFSSRCEGASVAILCETFITGNFAVRDSCGEFMSCQVDTAGKASCQPNQSVP